MIFLNEYLIQDVADFSTRFQSVLSLIQDGANWVRWAIDDKIMPACRVGSEDELLLLIQRGLHADEFIRLNTFRLTIDKLLTLEEGDIELLAKFKNTIFDNAKDLESLLIRNQLYSYAQITDAIAALSAETLRSDIFQTPSFGEQLLLTSFQAQTANLNPDLREQALLFAQQYATTIAEFTALFLFYTYLAEQVLPQNLIPMIQSNEVMAYYEKLMPLTRYLLYTPNVGPGLSAAVLQSRMQQLAGANRFIGYNTSAAALNNLVRNIKSDDEDITNIKSQIENYLASVKNTINTTPTPVGNLSQDGSLITFTINNEQTQISVGVDEAGNVFLLPETNMNKPS